jgi:hypothetical protein
MTKFEILLEWLKECPVDYIRHVTIENNIVVTFDISDDEPSKELKWQK